MEENSIENFQLLLLKNRIIFLFRIQAAICKRFEKKNANRAQSQLNLWSLYVGSALQHWH